MVTHWKRPSHSGQTYNGQPPNFGAFEFDVASFITRLQDGFASDTPSLNKDARAMRLFHRACNSRKNAFTEARRPRVDTFTELRQLADDLAELGDTTTGALVRQAIIA